MNECRYRAHISAVFNYSSLYLLGTVGLKLRSTLVFLESLRVTCLSCLRHDKQGILLGTNPTLVSFAVTHHISFNEKWLEQSPEEFQLILKQIINFRNMSLKKENSDIRKRQPVIEFTALTWYDLWYTLFRLEVIY